MIASVYISTEGEMAQECVQEGVQGAEHGSRKSDFFTIQLSDEGPTPCFAMIMVMDNERQTS